MRREGLGGAIDVTFATEFCTLANRQFVDTLWFAIKRLQSEGNEDYRFPAIVKLRAGRCAEGGKDHRRTIVDRHGGDGDCQ